MVEELRDVTPDTGGQKQNHADMDKPLAHVYALLIRDSTVPFLWTACPAAPSVSKFIVTTTITLKRVYLKVSASRFGKLPQKTAWRIKGEGWYDARMDEGRKRVLLIAASILAARKLAQFDGAPRVPATIMAIENAVTWADRIMSAIDRQWPAGHAVNDAVKSR
jgi:hypothetical protein